MDEIEVQDGDLENTEPETAPVATAPQEGNDRLKELEAEVAKYKRIAQRNAKKETKAESTTPESNGLIEKTFLRAAGITDQEEVELALSVSKKWGLTVDALVDDADWKEKLEKHRVAKANTEATAEVRGSARQGSSKDSVEYWVAKGAPPSADQVPDRKVRAKIARALMVEKKGTGKNPYYNG